MNRLIASVAAITALAVAPAAIAVDRALPQYRVSVTAADAVAARGRTLAAAAAARTEAVAALQARDDIVESVE